MSFFFLRGVFFPASENFAIKNNGILIFLIKKYLKVKPSQLLLLTKITNKEPF